MSRSPDAVVRAACFSALGLLVKTANPLSSSASQQLDRIDSSRNSQDSDPNAKPPAQVQEEESAKDPWSASRRIQNKTIFRYFGIQILLASVNCGVVYVLISCILYVFYMYMCMYSRCTADTLYLFLFSVYTFVACKMSHRENNLMN